MNNIEALILALLALNSLQVYMLFNGGHSQFCIWSLFISSCLPLSVIYFNLIPHTYRLKLKAICIKCSIRKILCYCFKDKDFSEQELSHGDVLGEDRMIQPDLYSRGDTSDSSEHGALLHNPRLLYTYN